MQLPSNGNANFFQKILSVGLIGGVALGVMSIFNNFIAPNIIWFLENVWAIALLGAPLALIAGYIITNPFMVWGLSKTLSVKLTAFLIKMDPLSVMDRYVEWLGIKLTNLNKTIDVLRGKKVKLDRKIEELNAKRVEYQKYGLAAIEQGEKQDASLYGSKMTSMENSISLLMPLLQRVNKNLELLTGLSENWDYSLKQLTFEIANKREEYEIIKESMEGLKSAEAMINSDNEAVKTYGMSLKELEEQVTQKMGYIEEFERKSKPLMNQISIEKNANTNEGLAALEKLLQKNSIYLPEDFKKTTTVVPQKQTNKKFNI